jgi:serine/threonine-protein kinase
VDTAAAYLEGRLSEDEVRCVDAHVDACTECRAHLAALARCAAEAASRASAEAVTEDESGPAARAPVPLPQDAAGRYRIADVLGVGGMGVVYAAADPVLGRSVALKMIRSDVLRGPAARERLLREARAMATLSHPNVVAVYDVVSEDDSLFLAMELVRGPSLRQWLSQSPRDWREILAVFLQAGRGLAAAHAAGIVHGDFKPDNVLCDEAHGAKVTDFGLSIVRAKSGGDHSEGGVDSEGIGAGRRVKRIAGTPAYMAPEQHEGRPADPRSDQFSFCASLAEALFGERLPPPPGTGSLMTPHCTSKVSHFVRAAVTRGLSVAPSERHASMAALLAELGGVPDESIAGPAATDAPPNESGERPRLVGRYEILEEIASGGMATVYVGRLTGSAGFARTVAIKRLHPQFARDPEFVTMFLDEARLASHIRHPNVVPTLDVVASHGELLLVMEYVQGASLSRLLCARGQPASYPVLLRVMIDVLAGLAAAHEATDDSGAPLGVIHRDVSPQNVLVGADGVARLIDFGVAKAHGRVHTTRDSRLKGKLAYMAPEQLDGRGVTQRTDLYAASVMFWEMLTGKRLFSGDNELDVVAKLLRRDVTPPSRFASGLPPSVDAVVMKGLSAGPAERFGSARAMSAALAACGAPATAEEVGAWVGEASGRRDVRAGTTLVRPPQGEDEALGPPRARRRAWGIAAIASAAAAIGCYALFFAATDKRAAAMAAPHEAAPDRSVAPREEPPAASVAAPNAAVAATARPEPLPSASLPPTSRPSFARPAVRGSAAVPSQDRAPRPASKSMPNVFESREP